MSEHNRWINPSTCLTFFERVGVVGASGNLSAKLADVEGKIPMAARRHVTNKLRDAYRRASKSDRGRILDEVVETTGMGRSTARRMLTGPPLPDPAAQIDRRRLRSKGFSDESRLLLVRKHAFHWRYDTPEELALLNELWPLVSLRLNFFTPTKKPTGYATTADGRRTRLYDQPRTPWLRVLESGLLTDTQIDATQARITSINPADLTRRINTIQLRLIELAQAKTEALATARGLDMASLEPSIHRLQTTK